MGEEIIYIKYSSSSRWSTDGNENKTKIDSLFNRD